MSRMRVRLHELLWGPETGARLLVLHTGLTLLIGVRIVFGPYRELAGLPDSLFEPVWPLAWLPGMPPMPVIAALQILGGAAALAASLRIRTRATYALAWGCYLALAGLFGSRGKVMHNDLLLLWAAAPLLLAPVGVSLADRIPRPEHGWPVRAAMVITAVIYGLAGYHKLRRSGLDWAFGDNLRYVLLWGPSYGFAKWEQAARWAAERWWVFKASSSFSLLFELTFPLALFRRAWLPAYALVAVGLHVMTYVFLGLDYWAWVGTVLLVFVDWSRFVPALRRAALAGNKSLLIVLERLPSRS